jgi:hypothetical protein
MLAIASDQARAGAAPGSAVAGRTIFSSRTLNSPVIPRLERSSRRVPMRLFLTWDGVVANVETTRRSKSITKQPMLTWFVCTTNNGPLVSQQVSFMKPRVGFYLSEGMAARLAEAAKDPRATRSALVEATLDRFLGSDDDVSDTATVARRLAGLSRQLEELDRNLRIANETAALHARFHLAVTPLMPEREQGAACALGAERFDEFAIQVGRRVDLGVPLIRETIDRVSAARTTPLTPAEGEPSDTGSTVYEPNVQAQSKVDDASLHIVAVREDAATLGLQAAEAALFTDVGTCRDIEEGEGAVAPQRSAPSWLTGARQIPKDRVENRSLILRVFLPFALGYYIAYLFRTSMRSWRLRWRLKWDSVPTISACLPQFTS